MDVKEYGVHASHCCKLHGCKYMDEDCPVVDGKVGQEYTCEFCGYDNISSLDELNEYLKYADVTKSELEKLKQLVLSKDFDLNKSVEISGRTLKLLLKNHLSNNNNNDYWD